MDVDTAFLNTTLEKDIWVQIQRVPNYKSMITDISRCWNHLINGYLLEIGFQRLETDPSIYVEEIKSEINGNIIIQYQLVALYVDDLILAASN